MCDQVGGQELRRFPDVSAQDLQTLRELDEPARSEFQKLLRSQHRKDRTHSERTTPVVADDLEVLTARRRYGDGSGGGRRR
ncbi:MAG TPA: hypothetical protein VFZ00_28410 [Solirubrobacter sp.]|nr:hypothetical protein [Solirubrobacter sp.]